MENFKYGCKRVSYLKSGNQLAFYAPIYIEGKEDIQGKYFIITCTFNKVYKLTKKLTNEKIKEYAKLNQSKYREEKGLFIVEGPHLVSEAKQLNLLER